MEHDPEYVFRNIEEILIFVQWIKDNFDNLDDYETWFDVSIDYVVPPEIICTRNTKSSNVYYSCPKCQAKFSTKAGLDVHDTVLHKGIIKSERDKEFWDIINASYKEESDEHKQGTDTNSIPDTD